MQHVIHDDKAVRVCVGSFSNLRERQRPITSGISARTLAILCMTENEWKF